MARKIWTSDHEPICQRRRRHSDPKAEPRARARRLEPNVEPMVERPQDQSSPTRRRAREKLFQPRSGRAVESRSLELRDQGKGRMSWRLEERRSPRPSMRHTGFARLFGLAKLIRRDRTSKRANVKRCRVTPTPSPANGSAPGQRWRSTPRASAQHAPSCAAPSGKSRLARSKAA